MNRHKPGGVDLPVMREAARLLHSWANAIQSGNPNDQKAITEAKHMRATAKRLKANYNQLRSGFDRAFGAPDSVYPVRPTTRKEPP